MAAHSASVEDYVKAIYSLTREQGSTASTSALADRLQITTGSVSTMIKRMAGGGLVEHAPYHGVRLTEEGHQLALRVIRRHRLLELFLSQSLDIRWEDVHRFADALEHAASDELIELIAAKLGDPTADPHGDPIPTRDLQIDEGTNRRLSELRPGEHGAIVRVSDADPEMLRYLGDCEIAIGDRVEMIGRQPFGGPYDVRIGLRTHALGADLVRAIRVQAPVG
jgi:DtxR family Mn-dependent transcriptional regulator